MSKGRQTCAESGSTRRRANCPVRLTDDSLMKRELYSSQLQEKKLNSTKTKRWCLLTATHWCNLRFYEDTANVFLSGEGGGIIKANYSLTVWLLFRTRLKKMRIHLHRDVLAGDRLRLHHFLQAQGSVLCHRFSFFYII